MTSTALPPVPPAPAGDSTNRAISSQIRGSSLLLVGRLFALGVNFAVQVLIVRFLSKADYGAFAYGLAIVSLVQAASMLGLDRTLGRFLPLYQEQEQRGRLLGAMVLSVVTVIALGVCLIAVAFGLQSVLARHGSHSDQLLSVVLILILLAPIQALDGLLIGMFAVFSKPRAIFFRKYVLAPGLRLVVALALVLGGFDVVFLAAGYVVAGALGVAIYGSVLVRTLRDAGLLDRSSFRRMELPVREIFSFTLPLLAVDAVFVATTSSAALLLEHYRGTAEVAAFRAVLPAAQLNQLVLTNFALLFTPLAARLFARGDRQGLNQAYWETATWITVLSFPVFALTFSTAQSLTPLLFGSAYHGSAAYMALLSLGYYVNAALGFNALVLRVFGLVRYIVTISLVVALANIAMNLLLVPAFGALGAAIGTLLTLLLHSLLRHMGLRRGTGIALFEREYGKICARVVVAAVLLLLAVQLVPEAPLDIALAALVSALVVLSSRDALRLGDTFPELLRFRLLRRALRR